MNITFHFTLEEFERSKTADKHGIDNTMPARYFRNLEHLCSFVLEPIRNHVQCSIIILSGYRCPKLNELVGGVDDSQHGTAQAADLYCERMDMIIELCKAKMIRFDQLIIYPDFLHISACRIHSENRMMIIDKR